MSDFVSSFGSDSPKEIMPNVASADNQSDTSKIALGFVMQITRTATDREVIESLPLPSRNKSEEIISIIPARHTDTENPVIAIYRSTREDVIATLVFFFILIKVRNLSRPSERIARCIPLNAKMCEIPTLLKLSDVLLSRYERSPITRADSNPPVLTSVASIKKSVILERKP